MSRNKIAVIIPYFGKLPDNYDYWEKTALKNDSVDFILFTDNARDSKKNIRIIKMSFRQYTDALREKISDKIVCPKPYKLCDFKPAIGVLWKELLVDYDFWGFCDLDLLFGNIRKFITDDILDKNDKIFITGHFSLYRNTKQMNELFMDKGEYPEYNYEEAFTVKEACYFDEFRGMNLKCIRNGINVYHNKQLFLDINPSKFEFVNRKGTKVFCVWKDGKLSTIDANGDEEEWLYIHFQKRNICCGSIDENKNSFIMIPNFIRPELQNECYSLAGSGRIKNYIYSIKFYSNRVIKNLKDYSTIGMIKRRKRQKDVEIYKKKLCAIYSKS